LVTAKPSRMEESKKKDRRGSIPLPAAIAATAEAARKEASRVIGEVLQQAGGSGRPDGAAPSSGNNQSNQEAMDTTGRASVPYRNFHQEGAASGANPPPPSNGRYEFIKIQRAIRGEHATSGEGPKVDSFKCGSFIDDNLSSTNRANVQEDTVELMVSSTSFSREDWVCISCDVGHKLLPRKRNKPQWTKGRKLVILSDQNMPAAMPSLDEKCPAIIRVEGALLSELGDIFYSLLRDFTLPEGSILLIGSLSHLMEEGMVGYAKSLGASPSYLTSLCT
jgi:hypothetical protein